MQSIQDASGDSLPFLKAQIVSGDQELRDIIKDIRQADVLAAGKKEKPMTKKSLRTVLPYRAHPQLVPMDEPMSVSEAMNAKSRQGYEKGKWQWERNTGKWSRPAPSTRL